MKEFCHKTVSENHCKIDAHSRARDLLKRFVSEMENSGGKNKEDDVNDRVPKERIIRELGCL